MTALDDRLIELTEAELNDRLDAGDSSEEWMDVLWGRQAKDITMTPSGTNLEDRDNGVLVPSTRALARALTADPAEILEPAPAPPPPGVDGASILVVESDSETARKMLEVLGGFSCQAFRDLSEVHDAHWWGNSAVVVALGPSQAEPELLEQVGTHVRAASRRGAVLVMDDSSAVSLRGALRAGLSDAISLDQVDEELYEAVRDLAERLVAEEASYHGRADGAALPARPKGRVTSVFSPKGGVGKTTVSVNLASLLAKRGDRPVVILDLDIQFGDVAVMLRVEPTHHVAEAGLAGDLLDDELLRSLLSTHADTGVKVLAAPADPTMADHVTPATVTRMIELLRESGAHVVIDCAPHLDGVILQALSESDDIVYVTGMDVPTLKNARIGLQALDVLQIPKEKVLLLLNRADSGVNLEPKDVERTLNRKIDVAIPSDAAVPRSVNRGVPAVLAHEKARFSKSMGTLANTISARAEV